MSAHIKLSEKLCCTKSPSGETTVYTFFCPGCRDLHGFTLRTNDVHPQWTFNGNVDRPTFTPSLLCNARYPESRCHLFLTDGKIQFLDDCHHDLRGTTVEMVSHDGESP